VTRIAAHIGIIPSWFANVAKLEKGCKTVGWIKEKWPKFADQIEAEPQIFLTSLAFFLQQENVSEFISLGTAENIGCKVSWLLKTLLSRRI